MNLRRALAAVALVALLGGCASPAARLAAPARSAEPPVTSATSGTPAAPAAAGQVDIAGRRVTAAAEDPFATIRDVIDRGNTAQVQAIASGDPSAMADTSTTRYYQELAQINQDLLAHGVTAIRLLKLEWGDVSVDGTAATATATTYETWRTIYRDGTVEDGRDRNVYTVQWDGDRWRIAADAHPDQEQPAARPGAQPAPAPTPAAPEPRAPAPEITTNQSTSTNWSGYAATGGSFTSVSGSWTVPQATLDGAFGASAAWVGIGGTRSRDLIQAGTQQVVSGTGRASYQAWVELLPAASQPVPLTVEPGDSVTVSITLQSGSSWLIELANNTSGQTYQQVVQYTSSLSSAEWIQEAPSVGRRGIIPLDDFGQVQFTGGWTTKNGSTVTIADAGARPIRMVDGAGQTLATPSTLDDNGTAFSVARTTAVPAQSERFTPNGGRSRFGE